MNPLIAEWLHAYWKPTAAVLSGIVLTVGGAYEYNESIDTRFDEVETRVELREESVDNRLQRIEANVVLIRCMNITQHSGGDPLECLKVYDQ